MSFVSSCSIMIKRGAIMEDKKVKWLTMIMELQSIAQSGLTYGKDMYDKERYQRLREIAATMLSLQTDLPIEKIDAVFCNETGYQTPKLDTRAAIFKDGKILLVQENNGTWTLPGGWVDVLETIQSNTIKEVKEETGLDVETSRIIALQDRNLHNQPIYAYGICKVFVLCKLIGGHFVENIETLGFDYFALEQLPTPLANEKVTKEQIAMCFSAYQDEQWQVIFD